MKYTLILFMTVVIFWTCKKDDERFTILCWPGYNEPLMEELIESKIPQLDLEFITYSSGEEMIKKFRTNKNEIDLVVVDAEYGKVLAENNEIQFINSSDLGESIDIMENEYMDFFKPKNNPPGYDSVSNKFYCVIVRWGTIGLIADKTALPLIDSIGYRAMYKPMYKNKVSLFDWYLPNMGLFSKIYLYENNINKNPYDLTRKELESMYATVMKPLRSNVEGFYSDLGRVIDKVSDTTIYLVPGIGEWALGNTLLANQNFSKDWLIPLQGGIVWIEALAIPSTNSDKHKKQALEIIKLFCTKEIQSKLAWSQSYTSQVPNSLAYENPLMTDQKRQILKYDSLNSMLSKLSYRKVPHDSLINDWLRIWTEFKN